jgi:hypothetical protein
LAGVVAMRAGRSAAGREGRCARLPRRLAASLATSDEEAEQPHHHVARLNTQRG